MLSRRILTHHDRRGLYCGMFAEGRLDLSQFNAEAPNLDLLISSAEQFEVAVRPVASEIAGVVQACAGIPIEWMEHKLLCGEFRPVAVNRVVVDELVPGDAADPGVWAEWTRACCSHRDRIEEFVDPIVDFLDPSGSTLLRQVGEQHVESQMRVVELQNPTMHKSG